MKDTNVKNGVLTITARVTATAVPGTATKVPTVIGQSVPAKLKVEKRNLALDNVQLKNVYRFFQILFF